jgi:small ligand-binding sensory domain FIST
MRSGGLERASAALVFATTAHGPGFTRVTRTASEVCGTDDVVGCSAAGVLAGEQEVEGGAGVAVLVIQGDVAARRFFVPLACGAEQVADEISAAVGPLTGSTRLLFLFADSYNAEPESLLRGLGRAMPGVAVVGGGASEDGSVGEVSVFSGNATSSHAVAGVALAGDFRATVGVTQAVRRVGPIRRVTAARGNLVLALDGRPAYEAFTSVVPAPLLQDMRRALAVVLVGLSVAEDGFVARHLVAVDPRQGALAVAVPVREGQELFFGVRDPHGARADLKRLLASQAAAWPERPAAGALYVNCVGRGRGFHGVPGLDTAYIRQELGTLPVAGFFSGAEFAPGGEASQRHQYSGVLVMLGGEDASAGRGL